MKLLLNIFINPAKQTNLILFFLKQNKISLSASFFFLKFTNLTLILFFFANRTPLAFFLLLTTNFKSKFDDFFFENL